MHPDLPLGHLAGEIPKIPPQMFPGCFRISPRCILDVSKGLPDASQLPPYLRCATDASPQERPGKAPFHILVLEHDGQNNDKKWWLESSQINVKLGHVGIKHMLEACWNIFVHEKLISSKLHY
jgi:hypothetical protein